MADQFKNFVKKRKKLTLGGRNKPEVIGYGLRRGVSQKDLADFTRQLAVMIQARLSLTRCFHILIKQQRNKRFKTILSEILARLQTGKSLQESLSLHPRVFGAFYRNLVEVGEMSGNLTLVLDQLAVYLEKMNALRRKLFTAMTYPLVIVAVAIGAISFLMFGVLPSLSDMLTDFQTQMPWPARVLLACVGFVRSYGVWLILGVLVFAFSLHAWFRKPSGRRVLDAVKLRMPIIGGILKKIIIARFTRTLGTLLSSGISFIDGLKVTSKTIENRILEDEIELIRETVSRGDSIEKSLEASRIFPPLVVQMIAVGEETAELPDMLVRTAVYYESEVDASIEAITSIIEPVIIVVLGVLLGGIMISIYLQIFDVMNVIQ